MGTPEAQPRTVTKLDRIAWLSKQDSTKEFQCLMHLFCSDSLTERFHRLNREKAMGIDGVDKTSYERNLEENIQGLLKRMKDMAYRPGPVREVRIPKEGKQGATRSLGISNLEDKIVQGVMKDVLESIYEPLFLDCSYGCRPGRGCHDAIRALQHHLYQSEIQTVIDIDLKDFFGSIDHNVLEEILRQKVKDERFMRYIIRMFKAGVLAKGELRVSEEGVPQGSICSPILANIFAHYAIDVWIQQDVQPRCRGTVRLFRYVDDAVICCQYAEDAQRIRAALPKRLARFKLQLNEEKTSLVPFDKRLAASGVEQGTFDFLGFTFYLGKSKGGRIIPKLRTRAKTMRAKLRSVRAWIKEIRSGRSMKEIWKIFKAKLRGHIQYFGVSHNQKWVEKFLFHARTIVFQWLNRRSQRKSFSWEKYNGWLLINPLPRAIVVHPLF